MPKVSVIIPTYNCAKYIGEAIDSVLNQTYTDHEIIVIDDGSTDNTKKILKHYKGKIKYIHQENQGVAAARNTGIKNSEGEFIAFLDADDIWLPEKLEKQMNLMTKNNDYGFVYCDNFFVNKNGNIIENYVREIKLIEGDILLNYFMNFFLITSGVVLRKKCIEKTGLFNEKLDVGEDIDFFLRLCKHYKAGVIKDKLLKRRVWQNSLSRGHFEKSKLIDIDTIKRFLEHNPRFYNNFSSHSKYRIAEIYFKLGYYFFETGNRLQALINYLISLKHFINIKSIKGLIKTILPFGLPKKTDKSN